MAQCSREAGSASGISALAGVAVLPFLLYWSHRNVLSSAVERWHILSFAGNLARAAGNPIKADVYRIESAEGGDLTDRWVGLR